MGKLKLGWIGLGNMGIPMAMNLVKAGFEVSVFNRTKDKEKELVQAGATSAVSMNQLVKESDIVMTMLSNDDIVKDIYTGTNGLLSDVEPGKLFINLSTVAPETSRYLLDHCNKKGVDFMEAPVSGSVRPAQEGKLIVLAGGKKENFLTAKAIFDVIGKLTMHLGEVGTAASAKLAINYLLALNLQGLAETILFAQEHGISRENMLTIINEGACGNDVTKVKSPLIINNVYPAASALRNIVKDLRLAKETGLASPLMQPLYNSFEQAQKDGYGEEDMMAIIKFLGGR